MKALPHPTVLFTPCPRRNLWPCISFSTHTLFIPNLTPIAPPFSPINAMPVDLYIRLLFLYNTLCLNIDSDFPVIDHLTLSRPPMKPLFWTSGKHLSLQRSSFLLDFYAPLSLDYAPVLDSLLNSQTTPDTSRILGIPRIHPKYSD